MRAPSMWQNGRIRAPASTWTSFSTQFAPTLTPCSKPHLALEDAVHVDDHVLSAGELAAHVDARRIGKRHAAREQLRGLLALEIALQLCQLLLAVHSQDLEQVCGLHGPNGYPVCDRLSIRRRSGKIRAERYCS